MVIEEWATWCLITSQALFGWSGALLPLVRKWPVRGGSQELKDLRRAGVRTFAEADAYEVEHRRRRALSFLRVD